MSVRYDVKKALIRSILGCFWAARTSAATRPTLQKREKVTVTAGGSTNGRHRSEKFWVADPQLTMNPKILLVWASNLSFVGLVFYLYQCFDAPLIRQLH